MIIANLVARLRAYFSYRRNRAILSQLSDRDLADIGLRRGNIDYAARHPFGA